MKQQKPLVSVLCTSYNHEKYIEQCLEGILSQKTQFAFEIIINDDASTDGTIEILKKYEKEYKDLITVIYHDKNEYSQKKSKPLTNLFEVAQGDYLAFCECDDYWNDDKKLQFQIDYLEKEIDVYATYHNVRIINQDNKEIQHNGSFYEKKEQFCDIDLIRKKGMIGGQLASLVARNFWGELSEQAKEAYANSIANGDQLIYLTCLSKGKIYFFEPKMATYRHIESGGSSWSASVNNKNILNTKFLSFLDLENYYKVISGIQIDFKDVYKLIFADALFLYLVHPTPENKLVVADIKKRIGIDIEIIYLVVRKFFISVKQKLVR